MTKSKRGLIRLTHPFPMDFCAVPEGEFLMGSIQNKDANAHFEEMPQRLVYVGSFYISRYPVTNAQYKVFLKRCHHFKDLRYRECGPPYGWHNGKIPQCKNDHPVVNLEYSAAQLFCDWLALETKENISLPSEAEWEKAARGTDGRIYPWGNTWIPEKVGYSESMSLDTHDVGLYSPDSDTVYGVADMVGNVSQWVEDHFSEDYYSHASLCNPSGPFASDGEISRNVIRGGSFMLKPSGMRCAARSWAAGIFRSNYIGFRVVLRESEVKIAEKTEPQDKIRTNVPPPLLYKYLSSERIDILEDRRIRFTQPAEFNDPFDVNPFISLLFNKLLPSILEYDFEGSLPPEMANLMFELSLLDSDKQWMYDFDDKLTQGAEGKLAAYEILRTHLQKYIRSSENEHFGVLSLTEDPASLLMWAHYADSHRGFVVGFNTEHSFFNQSVADSPNLGNLEKVEYEIDRPGAVLGGGVEGKKQKFTKSEEWAYEKEWRMVLPLKQRAKLVGKGPHQIYLFKLPPSSISRVIIGANMEQKERERLCNIIEKSRCYRHVQLFQAQPDPRTYRIVIQGC